MPRPASARLIALDVLDRVLGEARPLDDSFAGHPALASLDARDRAFARLLVTTVLLFVPVVSALATDRAGRPEAAAAMALGVSAMLAVHLWTGGRGVGAWRADTIGLAVAALAFALVFSGRRAAGRRRTS